MCSDQREDLTAALIADRNRTASIQSNARGVGMADAQFKKQRMRLVAPRQISSAQFITRRLFGEALTSTTCQKAAYSNRKAALAFRVSILELRRCYPR
jgi:hypothetical protein